MIRLRKSDEPIELKKIREDFISRGVEKVSYNNLPSEVKKIVREILLFETTNRCTYCQSKINNEDLVVDNFFPKSKPQYQDKALQWENLFACCSNCNSYKGSKFPLDENENPLLINPFLEDPLIHFLAKADGSLEALTTKGTVSIDVLGLNRFDLRHLRQVTLNFLANQFQELSKPFNINTLLKHDPDFDKMRFSGFIKNFIENNTIGAAAPRVPLNAFDLNNIKIPTKKENELRIFRNKTIYIALVQIKNFKVIDDLRIEFKKFEIESRVPCLMLLGENGVGKTSIIQAISLALLSKESTELETLLKKNQDLIKNPINSAEIEIQYSENELSRLNIYRGSKEAQNTGQKLPILSYGAIRIERKIPKRDEHIKFLTNPNRIHNAFNPRELMINANYWLVKLTDKEFHIVKEILEELLQLNETGESLERNRTSVFVIKNTNKVKIYLWSEGRRNVLVLVCDMLAHLSALWDKGNLHKDDIKEYSGVVMIDEIGAHLHPTWKMKIVSQLRKTFPKLQFICTTHDPLCLIGFKQGEIVVLRKDKDGKVFMVNQEDLPNPEAMRADQLLTSQYFGLNSTIDLDIEKKFAEYYDLLARGDKLSDQNKERLKTLKDFIQDKKMLGDTTREKLYYDIIDKVLAERNLSNAVNTLSLKEEVIQRINEALKSRKI